MKIVKKAAVVALALCCSTQLFAPYKEIESERQLKEEIKKQPFSIVSFHSPECPKCKIFMPAYRNLGPKTDVMLYGVNIDVLKGLRHEYQVISTPTVYLLNSKDNTREPIKWGTENVKKAIDKIHNLQKKQLTLNNNRHNRYVENRNNRRISL